MHRVTAINLDGTVTLEDGRVMRLLVNDRLQLGVRPDEDQDRVDALDQVELRRPASRGEHPAAPVGHFDLSGLDQS